MVIHPSFLGRQLSWLVVTFRYLIHRTASAIWSSSPSQTTTSVTTVKFASEQSEGLVCLSTVCCVPTYFLVPLPFLPSHKCRLIEPVCPSKLGKQIQRDCSHRRPGYAVFGKIEQSQTDQQLDATSNLHLLIQAGYLNFPTR